MEKSSRKPIVGLLFILVGTLFLLDNFDVFKFQIPDYLYSWQVILIAIGAYQFIRGSKRGGTILVAIGLIFWLPEYFDIRFYDYWPVILIAIGLGFFWRKGKKPLVSGEKDIDDISVLASSQKQITSKEFTGGDLSTVFGSIELDLRNSSLKDGKAFLESFCVFGNVKIFLPDDWVVNFEATNVLASFKDKRAHKPTEYFGNVLTIRGAVVLGSIELNS